MKEMSRTQERVKLLDERLPKMRRDADDIIRRAEKIWHNQSHDAVLVDHPPRHGGDSGYLLGVQPSRMASAEDIRFVHLRNRVDGSLLSQVEGTGAAWPPQTL